MNKKDKEILVSFYTMISTAIVKTVHHVASTKLEVNHIFHLDKTKSLYTLLYHQKANLNVFSILLRVVF